MQGSRIACMRMRSRVCGSGCSRNHFHAFSGACSRASSAAESSQACRPSALPVDRDASDRAGLCHPSGWIPARCSSLPPAHSRRRTENQLDRRRRRSLRLSAASRPTTHEGVPERVRKSVRIWLLWQPLPRILGRILERILRLIAVPAVTVSRGSLGCSPLPPVPTGVARRGTPQSPPRVNACERARESVRIWLLWQPLPRILGRILVRILGRVGVGLGGVVAGRSSVRAARRQRRRSVAT